MKSGRTIIRWIEGLLAAALLLGLPPLLAMPRTARAATIFVTVTKYAADGTTVLARTTVTYQQMRDTMTVLGDGSTHYYLQGPVFFDDPDPDAEQALRWNASENTNVLEKDMGALRGTNIKTLCNLVGGMSAGDELKVRSSDGWNRTFAYQNVYRYSAREGPMVLTWEKDGMYPDTGYGEGMRLVWFADASVNPWDVHCFGNWDWHEAAEEEYWYYYRGEYPTTTGLSGQTVSDLIIYSNLPATYTITASAGANGSVSPAGRVPVGYGASQTFTIIPNTGYEVADVMVDGGSKGSVTSYTFTNVKANHTISAAFARSGPALPIAAFTADVVSGAAPLTVHFTDQSTGSPASWAWDFDSDGEVDGTQQNPTHTYTTAGTYGVKLTVSNPGGSDAAEKKSYIVVSDPEPPAPGLPVAAFVADVVSGPAPLTVQFADSSAGNPTAWEWDFDSDGEVDSTQQNPAHTYTAAGTYGVKLTVTNSGGSDADEKRAYIVVSAPEPPAPVLPVAGFAADVVNGTAPLNVQFTDGSTGDPTAWAWDFDGDGEVDSTQQNPAHTYTAAGAYAVKLTATNPGGSDAEEKIGYIRVRESESPPPDSPTGTPVPPMADFTVNLASGPGPLTVHFTDNSTGNPTAWAWDFDSDGMVDSREQNPVHTFDAAGTYDVMLTVSSLAGTDSEVKAGTVTVILPARSGGWIEDHYLPIVVGVAGLAAAAGVAAYALKARRGSD